MMFYLIRLVIGLVISIIIIAYFRRDNEPLSMRDAYELSGVSPIGPVYRTPR